jgi:hypothetical protein
LTGGVALSLVYPTLFTLPMVKTSYEFLVETMGRLSAAYGG